MLLMQLNGWVSVKSRKVPKDVRISSELMSDKTVFTRALCGGKEQAIRRTARLLLFTDCLRLARRKPEKEHGHETFSHGLAYRSGCGTVAGV